MPPSGLTGVWHITVCFQAVSKPAEGSRRQGIQQSLACSCCWCTCSSSTHSWSSKPGMGKNKDWISEMDWIFINNCFFLLEGSKRNQTSVVKMWISATLRMMRKAKKTSTKSSRQLESMDRRLSLYGKSGWGGTELHIISQFFIRYGHNSLYQHNSNLDGFCEDMLAKHQKVETLQMCILKVAVSSIHWDFYLFIFFNLPKKKKKSSYKK